MKTHMQTCLDFIKAKPETPKMGISKLILLFKQLKNFALQHFLFVPDKQAVIVEFLWVLISPHFDTET